MGEFKNSVRQEFKLESYLAGFELDLELLLAHVNDKQKIYLGEIEKRDLTVRTTETYAKVLAKVRKVLDKFKAEAKIMPISIYQPEGAKKKSVSVHLEFRGKIDAKKLGKIMEELEKIS